MCRVQIQRGWKSVYWPLGIPFALFSLSAILAVITAVDPANSFSSLKKFLEILIVFWVANTLWDFKPQDFLKQTAAGLKFSWLQRLAHKLTNILEGVRTREFFIGLLLITACLSTFYGFFQALAFGVSTETRVEGTFSVYMTYAGLLMLAGLLAFSRLLFKEKGKVSVTLILGVLVFCLLLTLTRQAWLGLFVGAVFLIAVRKPVLLWLLPVVFFFAYTVSPPAVKERMNSFVNLKDVTFVIRLDLWKGGLAVFKDHPITGCGFKCVDTVYAQYPEHAKILKRYLGMHNNFVQIAVDTGILGLAAFVSIWGLYFFNVFRLERQKRGTPYDRWVDLGCCSAVLAFLAGGLFEVNFYDSEVIMLVYFLMGVSLAIDPEWKKQNDYIAL